MAYTKTDRKGRRRDLEAEVIERCVRAIMLEGRGASGRYVTTLDSYGIARVLKYLKLRFNIGE